MRVPSGLKNKLFTDENEIKPFNSAGGHHYAVNIVQTKKQSQRKSGTKCPQSYC
jgi:hypothetical protein